MDRSGWPQCVTPSCYQKFAPDGDSMCYNCREAIKFEQRQTSDVSEKLLSSIWGEGEKPDPSIT
jgi:hypothetical protein